MRQRRAPYRFPDREYVSLTDNREPKGFDEAMLDAQNKEWYYVMQAELDSLHENHTYELVELPKGKKALKNKWVYKLKPRENGNPPRYNARIGVKGFQQKRGVDFDEILALLVKMTSIRTVFSVAANMNLEIEQLDAKKTFLHGVI